MAVKYEQTHSLIIQKGIGLICEKGYEAVTIEEICEAAEVARSTFYHHFKTKEKLVWDYFDQISLLTPERLAWAFGGETAYERAVRLQLSYYLAEENYRNVELYIVRMRAFLNARGPELLERDGPMRKTLIPLIEQAQAAGEIRNRASARDLSDAAAMLLWGNIYMWGISDGSFDRPTALRRALETLYDVRPDLRR